MGSDPILAIGAVVVTAEHAEAHSQSARESVKERFLFDGITLQGAHIALGDIECSTLVETNLADSGQTLKDEAAMPTSKATHASGGQLFVEYTLLDPFLKNLLHGG